MGRPLALLAALLLLLPLAPAALAQPGTVQAPAYPTEISALAAARVTAFAEDFAPYRSQQGMQAVANLTADAETAAEAGRIVPTLASLSSAAALFEATRILAAAPDAAEGRDAYLLSELDRRLDAAAHTLGEARAMVLRADGNLSTVEGFEAALYAARWTGLAATDMHTARLQQKTLREAGVVPADAFTLTLERAASARYRALFALTLEPVVEKREAEGKVPVNLTALATWTRAAGALKPLGGENPPAILREMRSVDPEEERVYAVSLFLMNLASDRAQSVSLRYNPLRTQSEDRAIATLDEEVRSLYGADDLLGIGTRWGYSGLLALHQYDAATAVLEREDKSFDDLAHVAGGLKESKEGLSTVLLHVSPLGDADRLRQEAKKTAKVEQAPEAENLVPFPAALLLVAGLSAALVLRRRA